MTDDHLSVNPLRTLEHALQTVLGGGTHDCSQSVGKEFMTDVPYFQVPEVNKNHFLASERLFQHQECTKIICSGCSAPRPGW